jgi:hypothetical protein
MANIPAATAATPLGVDITTPATAAALSMTMANDGKTQLHIKTGATTANLTLTVQSKIADGSAAGIAGTNPVIALAANKNYVLGPFSPGAYNDANGELNMAFSAITSIVVQAVRVNPITA